MNRIHKLPLSQAQKIAAGEVVERPANVLKELLENSIDAGATEITVYLEEGGKNLIRIIDNGCGMSEEDARMSIVHHATSKITSVDDLMSLTTFGFRGEALSSMSSVSKIRMTTKRATDAVGTRLFIEDGRVIEQEHCSCNQGTDISIEDLFYAMPARKKFLKTTATEYRNCLQLFYAIALAYPALRFELYHNDVLAYTCRQEKSLLKRASQLYDERTSKSLLTLELKTEKAHIVGVVSDHQHMRYDRNQIVMLVNNRWVKNHGLSRALIKGYSNVLLPGRYPSAVLSLTVPPEDIDINVHPKKEEVQFLHAHAVEKQIEQLVKETIQNHHTSTTLKAPEPFWVQQPTPYSAPKNPSLHHFFQPTIEGPAEQNKPEETFLFEEALSKSFANSLREEQEVQIPVVCEQQEKKYRILAQFNLTYIVVETDEGLVMIDQHAAHEAILFERYSKKFESIAFTTLLFPEIIELTDQEQKTACEHTAFFAEQGIVFEPFGPRTIRLQATPVHSKKSSMAELIREMVSSIHDYEKEEPSKLYALLTRKLHASMACKASIKAGDALNLAQMETLIADLYTLENRLTCPHGRPTSWLVSLYDIERKFKRV